MENSTARGEVLLRQRFNAGEHSGLGGARTSASDMIAPLTLPEPLGPPSDIAVRPRAKCARASAVVLVIALAALSGFAFIWVWQVGHRGLFVLDESIAFDGAWRIYEGQVPYRDFVMPFGPVTFWLQALMFRLAGVDFSTLVLTAALFSVIATLVVVRLLWLLTSGSATWSLFGGLLTAVWYQAPFGIPWLEQTAFLFDFLALLLVLEGRLDQRFSTARFACAGVASALAVLSKQNAGAFFIVVCLGCLCLPWRRPVWRAFRAVVFYVAGGVTAALAFGVWLMLRSKPDVFLHYWWTVAASVGWQRVAYGKILRTLTLHPLLDTSAALFVASSLLGIGALVRSHGDRRGDGSESLQVTLAGWLCLSLPQFHSFFQFTTNNEGSNNNAFVGVCVAASAWLLARCLHSVLSIQFRGPHGVLELAPPAWALLAVLLSVALYSMREGLSVASTREVQEFIGARFTERVSVPRARRLLWGEPTRIPPFATLHKRDFEAIAAELARRHENFFVFPDTTILYGLLGRPSPQPLLYFHPGQSYALADQAELDGQIVRSLQANAVKLIVLERASFLGTHKLIGAFPQLKRWLDEDFRLAAEFGNYRLFERVPR